MRSAQARLELNPLIASLERWQTSVPERAVRFHLIRIELRKQIRAAMPVWWPWIDDEIVTRCSDRVRRLGEVAEPLAGLLQKADVLASEVRRLAARGAGNVELTTWLENKCREWLVRVERLGTTCERRPDLYRDEELFAATEAEVRLHHEAINQLREAERVLTTLSSLRAATLAARLPELRLRLYKEGCTFEWLTEIKDLVQPLKAAADRVQDPPPELGALSSVLTDLRNWSARLGGELQKEVEDLEERRRFKIVDWEPGDVKDLGDEAQNLRARLLDQAGKKRDADLLELQQEIADLRQACGYDASLETRFEQLRERPFNRPHLFQDWREELDRLRGSFKAIAQSNIGTLETRLDDTVKQSRETMKVLRDRALSEANSQALLLLEQDLRTFQPTMNVEEVLHQLRRVNEIARAIDRLEARAAEELAEVERKQVALTSRYDVLQLEAARVKGLKFEIPDLTAQFAVLSEGAAPVSLEERHRQVFDLTASLDAVEARFVQRCREQLAVQLGDVQRTTEILRRAGATPPAAETPVIVTGATPQAAVRAVFEARKVDAILRRMARDVRKALDARRVRLQSELRALRLEDLAAGDQEESKRLLHDLGKEALTREQTPMERLRQIAIVIERCDNFFTRLQKDQQSAIARLAELKRRFRDFNDEHLYRFSPVWADRVAALIYGIPPKPRQWNAVEHQLKIAEDLFSRVEPQGRRLAAEELAQAAETLRQRLRGGVDPSFGDVARKLLAELDSYSADTLPPATLRLRVLNASQRQG